MLRFGIRGHDMEVVPFEQLVSNIAAKGFCCTQLALKKAVIDFPVERETMTQGMAMYMKQVFESNKVDVAVLGCYLNLAHPDQTVLADTQKTYEAHVRFASLLGCGMVGTETGAVNAMYQYEPANHSDAALDVFVKGLIPVVEYAEKMGVMIGVEPVHKHIMCDIKRTRKVLDKVSSPNLQVIFDPTNIFSTDNYVRQDEIIEEAFDLLKEEIAVLHIKDFIIDNNEVKSRPLTLGDGLLNLPLIMKLAKKHKPFIHMLLEDSVPENAMQSKAYAEKVYAEQ